MRLEKLFPPEAQEKETRAVMTGQREVLIEGHRGLFSYETSCIRVRSKSGIWTVSGEKLIIDYFGTEDLLIKGLINSVMIDGDKA